MSDEWWEDASVMTSAYEALCMFCGGVGRSYRYRLKRVGERTDPCGTLFGKFQVLEVLFLYTT